MAHVRKQIRDRIASVLSTSVTLVKRRVYATRVYPLTEEQLPALTVYTGAENSNRLNMGKTDLNRSLTIEVDIYTRTTKSFDDDVDAIAVQIEEAIANDFTVNGLAKEAVLTGTDIQFSGDAEQPVGVAKLTFTVRYVTALTDVEAAK